ncbi:hypothetical protein EON65_44700 [archaeon]|nr:MAG: hypothetical protein EON65_44700 [archaeon]
MGTSFPAFLAILSSLVLFFSNVAVTMLNKAAFAKVDFQYPYALSAIHMACNIIGAQVYFLWNRNVKPKTIEGPNRRSILFFSVIFSLNIAIGNASLQYVSVNFNQVCRALVPVIVLVVTMVYFKRAYSQERKWAVVPIVVGVATAFYGDMRYTTIGIVYTGFCVVLAALKAVIGGELLTGDLKLSEMDLLYKMCPLALLQLGTISILNGEVAAIMSNWDTLSVSSAPQVVLLTGVLSFSLNVSSFIANKVTSPLTLCIAANIKQVLLVAFGTIYFGDHVSLINGLGIMIVIIGSYRYGVVTISEKP